MTTNRPTTAHTDCDHEATKAARAACRKARAAAPAEVDPNTCTTCGKGPLPYGMICRREAGTPTTCLRCCNHNHG